MEAQDRTAEAIAVEMDDDDDDDDETRKYIARGATVLVKTIGRESP